MDIILSIKSKYVEKILSWEKLYELRKVFTKDKINKVIIYESAPISRVVGEFEIEKVLYEPLGKLWDITKDFSCVDMEFFEKYFNWKEYWYAIKIKNPKRYKKHRLITDYWTKRPPQNYAFVVR